jgi:hypothetical protein
MPANFEPIVQKEKTMRKQISALAAVAAALSFAVMVPTADARGGGGGHFAGGHFGGGHFGGGHFGHGGHWRGGGWYGWGGPYYDDYYDDDDYDYCYWRHGRRFCRY